MFNKEVTDLLESMSPDEMENMVDVTIRLSIMSAVVKTGTNDRVQLAAQMFNDKLGAIDMGTIESTLEKYIPSMIEQGELIEMGIGDLMVVDPELLKFAALHGAMLDSAVPPGTTTH